LYGQSKQNHQLSFKALGVPSLIIFLLSVPEFSHFVPASESQNSHKNMLLSIFVMFKQLQLFCLQAGLTSEKKNKRSAFQMLE
jgi:hypothetical protein